MSLSILGRAVSIGLFASFSGVCASNSFVETDPDAVDCSSYPAWSSSASYLYGQPASSGRRWERTFVVWDQYLWLSLGSPYTLGQPGEDLRWRQVASCAQPPQVTYQPSDSVPPDIQIAPGGEMYLPVSPERLALHQSSHSYQPIVTAKLPPLFDPPTMDRIEDYVITRDDLVVVNPAPDEYLWIMEGKRHGFEKLSMVFTNTPTGNGAPLHTHVGEEAHVLMEGEMRYFLNGEDFVVQAPYIVNIPSMVPHAFMNVGEKPAQLIGIFPESNEWEYDVLNADVFGAEAAADPAGFPGIAADGAAHFSTVSDWYSEENRARRMSSFREAYDRD